MKVVVAPDSYKDALSASGAAAAMAQGVRNAWPESQIIECPLGDGGEGTLDALLCLEGIELKTLQVNDALGRKKQARWGLHHVGDGKSAAIVELAEAAGLQDIAPEERDARITSTFGVGQLIKEALDHRVDQILLTLGGSATNDGGAGMLQALGGQLLDREGKPLPPGGIALAQLSYIDLSGLDPRLRQTQVQAAVDVSSPLTGPKGASHVFGAQKGASPRDIERLDKALTRLADYTSNVLGADYRAVAGAGAAGGMGFAAKAFLNADLRPGIELVTEQIGFEQLLADTDLLIVGEGALDAQSLGGKTPVGAARIAKRMNIPCIALVGHLGDGWQQAHEEGITAAFALSEGVTTLSVALDQTAKHLTSRSAEIIRLWRASNRHGQLHQAH